MLLNEFNGIKVENYKVRYKISSKMNLFISSKVQVPKNVT